MALGDEEDEWAEQIKHSLRYSVRLMIKHPNIDPTRITEALGLKPNTSGIVGSWRKTPTGKSLPVTYKESGWSHWFRVERNRFFFQDVVKVIDKLEPQRDFLHEIVNGGGTIDLIIHLPGDANIGDHLQWRDMGRLSSLRIDLGIEVFPEFN
jgi:hypothetical protein